MRKAAMLAAFAAAIGLGGNAQAAGLYEKHSMKDAPIVVSAPVWTGFYVGVGIGAGAAVNDLDANVGYDNYEIFGLNLDGIGGEGIFGTVQLGYDRQIDNRLVAGVFIDYDFSDISTDIDARVFGNKVSADIDLEHMWSIGGRIGYLLNQSTMLYGLLAYTEANFDGPSLGGLLDIDDFQGYSVGVGLETQLSGNWFLKGEYRFTQLDSEGILSKRAKEWLSYEEVDAKADLEPSIHTARVVLTYKFDPFGGYHEPLK
jgi:outer membrane immunogenic protein